MQIVHVIASMDLEKGGPTVVVNNLAAAQGQLGHTVSVITELDSSDQNSDKPLDNYKLFASKDKISNSIIESADILHIHGVWDRVLIKNIKAANKKNKPYILAPHGMLGEWSLNSSKYKKKLAMMLGYRRMISRAGNLHCLNKEEVQEISKLSLSVPCTVIPNGIVKEQYQNMPGQGEFYNLYDKLNNRPYILFLGRLHFKKGLDILIKAFQIIHEQIEDVVLVVAGPDEGVKLGLENQIAAKKLGDRVFFTGPLYRENKIKAMSDAAVFCLPSRQEGFSVAVLEAMACGCPVVLSNECNFSEIEDYGAGSLTTLEPCDVAEKLLRYLKDLNLQRQAGCAAKDLVFGKYTWPDIANKSLDLYTDVLRQKQLTTKN